MTVIDLNCDVGELEDAALEAALMEFVTSANIACGGHAGDERSMDRVARLAIARGVRIGAHPGYPDRENFGRLEMALPPAELETLVLGQITRLESVVRPLGGEIVHIKPHGALYNSAARDAGIARAIGVAVARWNPGAVLFGLAGSRALAVWREMGFRVMSEGFADRRYQPDGSLRPRRFADALITDPGEAAAQAARLALEGVAQTISVHSDTPGAPGILRACRESLAAIAKEATMETLQVRIERLPEAWFATFHRLGKSPENAAWRNLREWAAPKGMFHHPDRHPVFGFNNPPPSRESSEYGYELWIGVAGPDPAETNVEFKRFAGGLYAVTTCKLTGEPGVMECWRSLWDWVQRSPYRWRKEQELERVRDPNVPEEEMVLDLYLPITER